MKILLDQGVPRRAAALLRDAGLDTVHAAEVGLSTSTDAAILDWSRDNNRLVVTLDADFHAQLAVEAKSSPSVIRVRQEGLKGPEMARLIQSVVHQHGEALASGALLTVRAGRVRVHTLPVVPHEGSR